MYCFGVSHVKGQCCLCWQIKGQILLCCSLRKWACRQIAPSKLECRSCLIFTHVYPYQSLLNKPSHWKVSALPSQVQFVLIGGKKQLRLSALLRHKRNCKHGGLQPTTLESSVKHVNQLNYKKNKHSSTMEALVAFLITLLLTSWIIKDNHPSTMEADP